MPFRFCTYFSARDRDHSLPLLTNLKAIACFKPLAANPKFLDFEIENALLNRGQNLFIIKIPKEETSKAERM
jgi:hypothetical protein